VAPSDKKTPRERELEKVLERVHIARQLKEIEQIEGGQELPMVAKCDEHAMLSREVENLKKRDDEIEQRSINRDERMENKLGILTDKIDKLGLKMAAWGGGLVAITILVQYVLRYFMPGR